jgi:hypothetical protein
VARHHRRAERRATSPTTDITEEGADDGQFDRADAVCAVGAVLDPNDRD